MKKYKVYKITNKVNGKFYVGVTSKKLSSRFYQHSKATSYIGNAIRKYGRENFIIDEIFSYDNSKECYLKEKEIVNEAFLLRSDTYNLMEGGNGGDTSKHIDYENPERKENVINGRYGKIKDFEVHCHKCNSIIIVKEREKVFPKKDKYFCNLTCANSRVISEDEKLNLSKKNKENKNHLKRKSIGGKGTVYINLDGKRKRVKPEEVENYIKDGWSLGMK